ncbi:MAG TPA: ATP-binding protein [Desulfobacteraceae bacterium]|nr:ATP-binding protein [Desulfobacteraceae bacterium]
MNKIIGKVAATEKAPTTIDEFFFWTDKERILHPFDVITVKHIRNSVTFGVVEEISHITDAANYLTSYISSDFGDVSYQANTHRIGMNYVKARVVGNTENIYTPVLDGTEVCLASENEVREALGLTKVSNPLPCGYLEMYEGDDKVVLPVQLNSHFLIGPDGAHLNISGISGLAAKTSYTMFLLKAIQQKYIEFSDKDESIAFVIFNVKGRDLLSVDEPNEELPEGNKKLYQMLELNEEPFQNVTYFYPYGSDDNPNTYAHSSQFTSQFSNNKAFKYKYIYEYDKNTLELLFSNIDIDDSTGTMDSIINYIVTEQGEFGRIIDWKGLSNEVDILCQKQSGKGGDSGVTVTSWRKFKRIIRKPLTNKIFAPRVAPECHETRLREHIVEKIRKNDVFVIDIAKLDEDIQAYVFGDVIRSIYDLKLGQESDREDIPSKIIIFVDELNKYASTDVPKNSPILRQILDISERGRSLGIILFSAEQFKSAIHDRVKGNSATHAEPMPIYRLAA